MQFKAIFIPLVACCALLLGGCASSAPVAPTSTVAKHPESVAIKITGGSDTATATTSQVSRPQFVTELTKSLQKAALFGKVLSAEESGADYRLEIAIADLPKPEIGASMTATVDATWTLSRAGNGYEIWKKTISSSHTTQPREAFTGVERLRLAIEGAALANIHDGIQQLGTASIP